MDLIKLIEYIFFESIQRNRRISLNILKDLESIKERPLDDNSFQSIRKKILDNMNDGEREIKLSLDKIKNLI